jgi:hypothetical protein
MASERHFFGEITEYLFKNLLLPTNLLCRFFYRNYCIILNKMKKMKNMNALLELFVKVCAIETLV